MSDVFAGALIPLLRVSLIDAVNFSSRSGLDIFVGEKKFSQAGVERKAVNALPRGVHHHRAGTVNEVSGSQLFGPPLQAIFKRTISVSLRDLSVNRKYGADTRVDVDIRRPVERIKHQNVLAVSPSIRDRN